MNATARRIVPFILTIIIAVFANIASTSLFVRADLTKNRAYSLSDASKAVVANLEDALTIKAFFSKNLAPPYNNTEQQLRDLLEEYSLAAVRRRNRQFNYTIYSMSSKENATDELSQEEDEARKYRIFPIQIQNVEQDEVKLQTVYMGMVFIHGDTIETIPALTSTADLEYQITQIIGSMTRKKSALLALKQDIEVTLFLSENLNELSGSFEGLPDEIEATVDDLRSQFYNRLEFFHVDPTKEGNAEALERSYRLEPLNLRRRVGNEEQLEKAYASLTISLRDEIYSTGLLTQGIFGMQITDASQIRQIIEQVGESLLGIQEQVGYIADYGTPPLTGDTQSQTQMPVTPIQPDLTNFNALISNYYELTEIPLKNESIPDGLNGLVIAGPYERFSDFALFQIDQFLLEGNSLLLFLDSHSEFITQSNQFGQQEPVYVPQNTGLEEMLSHYGVELSQSYVLDEESFIQRQRGTSGGIVETPVYFAPIVSQDRISDAFPFLQNIPEIVMLNISPLRLTGDLDPETAELIFESSDRSWELSENINLRNPFFLQPPGDDLMKSQALAYIIEAEFTSFFEGKERPVKPVEEGQPDPATNSAEASILEGEVFDETDGNGEESSDRLIDAEGLTVEATFIPQGRGKIFVIGSSAILGSNVLDQEGRTGNAQFILNLIDYMNGREDYAIMRTKGQLYTPLDETRPEIRSFIKSFNIAGLSILVAVAGVLVWFARMSRKRRIQARFQASTSEGGTDR